MKHHLLLILIFIITINPTVSGKERMNFLTVSGSLANLIGIEENVSNSDYYPGYYKFPISIGMEIIFFKEIVANTLIGAGINYEKGRVSSLNETQWRFNYSELCFPAYLKRTLHIKNKNLLYITSGLFLGKLMSVKGETPGSFGWYHANNKYIPWFSTDTFYSDLYFDWGYVLKRFDKYEISISPYIKYRLNPVWLNHYERRLSYGLKINLTLKLKPF